MALFDLKIEQLIQEKSDLDLKFLENQKKEYEQKIYEILDKQSEWISGIAAMTQLNELKSYRAKIKEAEDKIQNNSQYLKDIDEKISFYREKKEWVNNIPLYRDTQEWIAEVFESDVLFQYAKETNNEELMNKLITRSLTPEEYTTILENDYEQHLANKHKEIENMYRKLFAPLLKKKKRKIETQQPPKIVIELPEWMSDQIHEELNDNKDIKPEEIESFLKKELKKNAWEIKASHIRNAFKDKYSQVYQYIKRLIINYPWFVIIDNSKSSNSNVLLQSKREKLVSQALNDTKEDKQSKGEAELLISRVNKISDMDHIEGRIYMYISLYEELWCKFADKISFLNELHDAINTYNHIPLEREIQKNLISIIKGIIHPMKLERYGYFAYKFGRSCDNWRIVMYPNWEIFKICSHSEYEKIINSKPPVDKALNSN